MRIKRIDVSGFKSFCDSASLDLRQPISAIVGPNGCGKSNIVDALRWAMGEQSARHLRGKSMDDVIFTGSDSRGPCSLAEVSITFETDHRTPAPYSSYAEVTVSRRLHRDGSSEYLINKLPVRLRDVTNLFLGTGVGTKAYSIIEQGRVGLIVSSKPEERRYFIEEVAGITKYGRRRQMAERKMEATRQNLLRVSDVLGEIGGRLGSLRRQAQKAERYKRYKEEMRDIELWSTSHRLLELTVEQQHLGTTVGGLEQQRERAATELERRELELESARLKVVEQERVVGQLQEELYRVDNRIKLGESQVEFQGREAQELIERADRARGEIDELRRQSGDEEAQIEEVRERAETTAAQRQQCATELASRQAALDTCRAELSALESALDQERRLLSQASQSATRCAANLRAAAQRRDDLRERAGQGQRETAQLVEQVDALGAQVEQLDGEVEQLTLTRDDIEQRRVEGVARLDELRQLVSRGEAELEVLRTELHRRRSRLASLQEIHDRYEGFGQGTRAIMQRYNGSSRQKGILGVVADVIEAPPGYEVAVEAVLGHRLGTVVVENDDVGVDAIHFLKESAQGRGSFIAQSSRRSDVRHRASLLDELPVGSVWSMRESDAGAVDGAPVLASAPSGASGMAEVLASPGVRGPMLRLVSCDQSYAAVADALLNDVVVVDNLHTAMDVWERVGDRTVVTLEGEIFSPDGTVTGGSQDAELSGILRQKRELKELSEIIAELQSQYDEAMERHVAVKTEIATLDQLVSDATRDVHQGEKDILTREKDLGRLRSEIEHANTRRSRIEQEIERIEQSLAGIDAEERGLGDELALAEHEQWVGGDVVVLLGRERDRLASLVQEASASVTDVKVTLAQAETAYEAIAGSLRQLERSRNERRQRIERLERSVDEGAQRAEELKSSAEAMNQEVADLVTQRARLQDELSAGRTLYDEQVVVLGELEAAIKGAREQVTALSGELGQLQLRATELSMARKHLDEQIWERYRVELIRVVGDYHLRPPVGEQQLARMRELRGLIERMGEINLTAIEEFAELNERYAFLDGQKQDLEHALNQLQRAIQKINRTCRERFVQTFDRVNAMFQEVFPRLFHGGKAKLVLTAGEDVLQGGVDIVAQPPGKKLVSLDMMSGGEKALTATSLIFAMFLVKPTPFCLLDEVDAPLDDANVLRLGELVKEMSSTSQFIVITHNHSTMEIADRLFGVTMEEPGISKLVSVSLSEAQRVAA